METAARAFLGRETQAAFAFINQSTRSVTLEYATATPAVFEAVEQIRKIVALHFRVLEENPELAEVVQVELRQGHKFFRGASAHEVSAYFDVIHDVLEEGAAAGLIRRDLPLKVATKMLFGAMDQMATSWVLGKRGSRLTDATDPVATVFLRGVCAHGI